MTRGDPPPDRSPHPGLPPPGVPPHPATPPADGPPAAEASVPPERAPAPPTTPDPLPRRPGFRAAIQEALRGTDEDFTSGSLHRGIFLLALPMVLEMAGEAVFAVVDAWFVARLGAAPLAAVGLTEAVLEVIYAVGVGMAMSTTALVARRVGERDPGGAGRAGIQAILLALAVGLALGGAGVLWAPDILRVMGADAQTLAVGVPYTRVAYASMPVILLLFVNNAIFRGAGDPAMAMRSVWLANGVNIALDPCLIFGLGPFPELGLTGAAVATLTGRGIGVLYQLRGLTRTRRLELERGDLRVDLAVIRRLARLSVGGVGQMIVGTASYIALIRILATFGSVVLAGYVIAIRVVIFVILPAWGLGNAAATLVGQNLGAGRPDRAERAVWITGAWNMLFMGVVTVLFVSFAGEIVGLFTADPETRRVGTSALRVISYGYVFYAWGMVMLQAFNGAGDTATPTRINLLVFWLFQIPLAWVLAGPAGAGPQGVFWAVAVSYSLSAVIGVVLFRRGSWKSRTV